MSYNSGLFGLVRYSDMPKYKHITFFETLSYDTARHAAVAIDDYNSKPGDWLKYAFASDCREAAEIAERGDMTWVIYDKPTTKTYAKLAQDKLTQTSFRTGEVVEVRPFVAPTKTLDSALDTALYALCVTSAVAALVVVVTFSTWLTALMIKDMLS